MPFLNILLEDNNHLSIFNQRLYLVSSLQEKVAQSFMMWEGFKDGAKLQIPSCNDEIQIQAICVTHPNPILNATTAFSKVVVCQTHSMDMLCWTPCSGLLQDGFRDSTVGIMRVCAVPCFLQEIQQMGYLVLVCFSGICYLQVWFFMVFFSCFFNNVKFSLQSSSSQLVLFSFLLQLIEACGVACRGKKKVI